MTISASSSVPARVKYDLVVSIVHYNTPALLRRCLESLRDEGSALRKKVVVVDNASKPPLRAEDLADFPDVTLVSNQINNGFGSANNQVFREWDGYFYLVTNPDVRVAAGTLGRMLERLRSRQDLGALGVRLRYPDGRLQYSCRRYPTLRSVFVRGLLSEQKADAHKSIQRYMMRDLDLSRAQPVEWVLGSCLLIKGEALKKTRGFDEGFFMYYEDIDLCYRIRKAGWQVEYYPEIDWVHDYRRESASRGKLKLRAIHFWSALRFLGKHAFHRGWLESF